MLNNIEPKVWKIIELAKKRNKDYIEKYPSSEKAIIDFADIPDYKGDDKLKELFYSLSYEDIKVIEAIMYIGRDKDYDKKLSPEDNVKEYIRNLTFSTDKGVEIEHIVSKAPLDRYLMEGLKILGQQ